MNPRLSANPKVPKNLLKAGKASDVPRVFRRLSERAPGNRRSDCGKYRYDAAMTGKDRAKGIGLALSFALGLLCVYIAANLGTSGPQPPTHPLTGRHIAGVATNTSWLDRAERESEEQPDRALDLIGIEPGSTVADVGAGSGYMTLRIARRVGPTGKVYANDLQTAMLQAVQDKVTKAGLSNVVPVLGTEQDARLPEGAIDVALLVDVYHEFWYPQPMLQSLRRALKPGGRLVLVEYRREDPSIPIADAHRMSVADARKEVEAEGFTFDRVIAGLPRQHIIVFHWHVQSEDST
jgi:predicted methyltransferase